MTKLKEEFFRLTTADDLFFVALPLINRFPNKPLIYNIAWKTVIYLADVCCPSLSGETNRFLATDGQPCCWQSRSCSP